MPGEAAGPRLGGAAASTLEAKRGSGTGVERRRASRRTVRLEGETVAPGRLTERCGWSG